ncbi:MAG: serine hydrolase, partial [Gemmatimonadetes bacterium]|nr:serine hydrolase [Gemmatimonadota bacterium]
TGSTLHGADGARIALPHRLRADGTYASEPFAKVDATMNSAGGHLSTLDDLARWTIIQMDGGVWDGRVVFPRTTVSLAHRLIAPHTREQARRFAYFDREGWGAGWDIGAYRGERMVSRFGGYASYRSHLSFLPGRRIGVVAMSTGGLGASLTDLVAAYTYDLEAGRSDAHRVAWGRLDSLRGRLSTARDAAARQEAALATRTAYPLPHPDAFYVGDYEAPGYGRVRVTASGRQLHLAWGVLEGRLIPPTAAADTLDVTLAGVTYPVTFEPSSGGAAPALVLERRRFSRAAR